MKRRNYIIPLYVFIILCCFNISIVRANGIGTYYPIEDPLRRSILILFIFIIGTSVEYGVYRLMFKINKEEKRSLLKSCYKVNFITFPITQILAYIIDVYVDFLFWIYIIFVEFLVISMEWVLLKVEFENRVKSSEFNGNQERFLSKNVLKGSIIANSSSFFIGLIAFLPPIFLYLVI